MWKKSYAFFWVLFTCAAAQASLLKATSFPTTVNDLSFIDRMRLAQEGYEPFESTYDDAGNCVSGCAYAAPRFEDELVAMARRNNLAREDLIAHHGYVVNDDDKLVPPKGNGYTSARSCAQYNENFEDRDIPNGNPLGVISCITSPYGVRTIEGKKKFHYGIDFRAATGTNVYAPANGTVSRVLNDDTCGQGIVLQHPSGYSTVYCHLSQILVKKDQYINAGCLIAKTGNSGYSTGPHFHYGVKDENDGAIDPTLFIEPGHENCGS